MKKPLIEEKFIWLNGRRVKALVPRPLSEKERRIVDKRLEEGLKRIVMRKIEQLPYKNH